MDWIVRQAEANEMSNEQAMNWIQERASELMKDQYSPYDLFNLTEAIDQADTETREKLKEYMQQRDFEKFGRAMWAVAFDYMENFAISQAEMEYSR